MASDCFASLRSKDSLINLTAREREIRREVLTISEDKLRDELLKHCDEKGVRHLNLRGRREALPGSDLGVTQPQEIEGNAPLMGR
jgi:hypothetical protein